MPAPEPLADELSGIARRAQADGRLPSLSACVFRDSEVIWEEAIGVADAGAGTDATPDTQYRVASITKTFVAASIMQLRDAGALDLDDPLSRHLPDVAHGALTLRRMLSHMSGIQREVPGQVWETFEFPPPGELLATAAEAEPVLGPGERWHYSNLAYALLGAVIEACSGIRPQDYVQERLLEPIGLTRTSWDARPPHARPYFVEPYSDVLRDEPFEFDLESTAAAGALWSTTRDLARWGGFLAAPDPNVLAPATVEQMQVVQGMAEPDWTIGWGTGLELFRRGERILAGHTGGFPGFLSIFVFDRSGTGAVALANSSSWPKLMTTGVDLAVAAIDHFDARREPWRAVETVPAEIEPLLGRWWSEAVEWVFLYRDGRLEARLATRPEKEDSAFEPIGDDLYRTVLGRERGELLRVVRDERGEPQTLYWSTYPFRREPTVFGPA